jgi:plasmid stability protein
MATMSIRGLDDKALTRLKRRAKREGSSLNSLVLRLLQEDAGVASKPRPLQKYDDLNALAGTWSAQQAREFERDTGAFSEVDASLWK